MGVVSYLLLVTCDRGKTKSTPSPTGLGLNCQPGLEFDKNIEIKSKDVDIIK